MGTSLKTAVAEGVSRLLRCVTALLGYLASRRRVSE